MSGARFENQDQCMRARITDHLWITALLVSALLLVSCRKSKQDDGPGTDSEASPVTNADVARVVPRRANPIFVLPGSMPAPPSKPAVTNTPPTITCGAVQNFPCSSADGVEASVTVHVEDADGDALTVIWSADGKERYTQQVPAGGPPTSADLAYTYTFTPGDHAVKVTVSDGTLSTTCDTSVSVQKDTQNPVIVCPRDITVMADPGQCSAVVTFTVKATDNCPEVTVVCDPPSGMAFPIGVTTVACTATDGAGNQSTCSFSVVVQATNRCPQNDAFWRQNPGAWPVSSLTLGNQVYSKGQLLGLLFANVPSDASLSLARQLIAASLNTAAGSNPTPICAELADANDLLGGFSGKLPFHVNLTSPAARPMLRLATRLNSYNNGMLTANCVP
jgi:hypothetical protein